MSAFDRLQNYSAKRGLDEVSEVFNTKEPEGAFLERVHKEGYKMYFYKYISKDGSEIIDEEAYNWLSDEDRQKYDKQLEFTELYHALTCASDQLINAIAGSGKTSMLIFKIMYDIVTGSAVTLQSIPNGTQVRVVNKMWVCTFLKSGATELELALTKWQRALGYSQTANQISFSTLDAEFKRCLNAMGVATPIGDGAKLHSLFCKAVDSCNITRSGESLSKEDYNIISSIVTYYRGRLDDKRYQHPSCADYDITPTVLDLLVRQFASLRNANGVMDFDEVQELLYKYLYITPNKSVQDFVANRYNFIYIDEFQDTSQMQYAILKFYARGRLWLNRSGNEVSDASGLYTGEETLGKIVAVGDPSQCIYSFKGSDANIIVSEFDSDFRPINCTLSTNWRCPSNILNPIIPSIHMNSTSASQNINAHNKGGLFKVYSFSSYKNMLSQLKKDMEEDLNENLSVAILCRTNFDGMIPALALEADKKFDFGISGENMTLNSPLPRKLLGVSSLFTERSTPAVKNALSYFVPYGGGYQVKQLIDTLKMNNMSIWQIPEADLKYSAPDVYKMVMQFKPMFVTNGVRDKKLELDALRAIYFWLMVNTFKGDSAYCESARAYLETLVYIIDENDFESIYEFIEEVEFLNDKLNARIKKSKAPIQIATVHEFKGKERDSIYIWNDSDGVFPSSKCDIENQEQLEEERRVHYIACTRAKKKEHIYTLRDKVGMFVAEMDCSIESPIDIGVSLSKKG